MLCLFELTDEEAGKMFKANYAYADEGIIPEFTGSMMTVFSMYRSQIDRCKEAYRRKCEKNRKNRLIVSVLFVKSVNTLLSISSITLCRIIRSPNIQGQVSKK